MRHFEHEVAVVDLEQLTETLNSRSEDGWILLAATTLLVQGEVLCIFQRLEISHLFELPPTRKRVVLETETRRKPG